MQKVHFLWTKIYMRQPKTLWFFMYPFLINAAAFSVLCLSDSKVGENVSYDMLCKYGRPKFRIQRETPLKTFVRES